MKKDDEFIITQCIDRVQGNDADLAEDVKEIAAVARATLPQRALKKAQELWPNVVLGLKDAARDNQNTSVMVPRRVEGASYELIHLALAAVAERLRCAGFQVKKIREKDMPTHWKIEW